MSQSFVPARWAIVCILLLSAGCRQPAEHKVLFIGIDGVRADLLKELPTPHLDSLAAAGWMVVSAQRDAPTVSGPMWSSMMTGVWPDKHGVMGNDFSDNRYDEFPDFLTRLEQLDSTFVTLTITDWPPLSQPVDGGPLLSDQIDTKTFFDGEELGYRSADELSVMSATELLRSTDLDAAFVYLGNPDVVAHRTSGRSAEYQASIVAADAQVGQIMQAIRRRESFAEENWLILVSTDHGHRDEGGHGGDSMIETTTFYIASGPAARGKSPDTAFPVDIAVIAMAHLGIQPDAAWNLDGHVVGLH